jgi:TonB-dependent Receptor Plug Domain
MPRVLVVLPLVLGMLGCSTERLTGTAASDAVRQYQSEAISFRPTTKPGPNPVVILDGVEVPSDTLRTMDPASIESVQVFKPSYAVAKYGERGRDGLVVIQTKVRMRSTP